MSKNVLPFPPFSPGQNGTPHPIHAAPGDDYLRINLVDDLYAYMGFPEGAVFITHSRKVVEGCMHYVELGGYGFLARLSDCTESTVHINPLDRETPPDTFARSELQFVGVIVEMYPHGLDDSRRPKEGVIADRPVFEAVAN